MVTLTWAMETLVFLRRKNGADGCGRVFEPARDFPVGAFQIFRSRAQSLEIGREFRAVLAESLQLAFELLALAAVACGMADSALKRVERRFEPPHGSIHRTHVDSLPLGGSKGPLTCCVNGQSE